MITALRMAFAVGVAAAVFTSSGVAVAETGVTNEITYDYAVTVVEGATDDLRGTWSIEIGKLAGGDPAVAEVFNHASETVAREQLAAVKAGVSGGRTEWNFESYATVSFRSIAVAQLTFGTLYYGAHPSHEIATIVIDSRSTDPIMLTDLFTDPQAGLNRLSDQTKVILSSEHGLEIASDEPGAAPIAPNFANWIPTAEGLEFHFEPYQFGPRLPEVITVPWAAVSDLLTPAMADLAR
jgi:hypothetical protein